MKFSFLRSFLAIVTGLVLGSSLASAQQFKAKLSDPTFEVLPSPDIDSVGGGKKFKPKDWIELEVKAKIESSQPAKSGYIDTAQANWYVLVKNPERSGTFLKLEKIVNHVNVEEDEDVYFSVYLSPSTLSKITGKKKAGPSDIEAVGVEILINGRQPRDGVSTTKKFGGKTDWWTLQSNKVVQANNFKLLDKSETPFKFLWWDRYVEIDEKAK